jgi:YidC/Oxa1 family membrane protein insertase
MEKNAIIAAVLSMAILIGWQMLVIQPMQKEGEKKRQERKSREESTRKKTLPGTALPPPVPSPTKGVVPLAEVPAEEERRVRVDVGSAVYEFTNRGAGLVSARLLRHPENICEPSLLFSQKCVKGKPLELVVGGDPAIRPFFFAGGDAASELNRSVFRIEGRDLALTPSNPEGTLRFVYDGKNGKAAEKTFAFRHDSYRIGLRLRVERPSDPKPIGVIWGPRLGGSSSSSYGGVKEGPMSMAGKELFYDYPTAEEPVIHGEDLSWTALQTKYFIAAFVPRAGAAGSETSLLREGKTENDYEVAVPLQGKAEAEFDVFIGPKEPGRMARLGVGLEDSLDYGYFSFVSLPLMWTLRVIHSVFGNWGVSIVLLTFLIKILFYPLTRVSMKNMKEMSKLQPRMTQIREIYKDDKQKMNEAVMTLYRENKVNPAMGCLPMVIQIPVFFGLYNALLVSIELRQAPFFGWITDLSVQDPFHVFTILMGASMFLQQKMTPTTGDPAQAKMMMMMPIMFTGMFVYFPVPSGLVIYWFVNNALSIIQQYFVNRSVAPPKLAEEGQ